MGDFVAVGDPLFRVHGPAPAVADRMDGDAWYALWAAARGRPLDVGPTCRTVEAASIDLEGPFELAKMRMKGVYAIPPFAGCQGRERLDPLLTGLISGPGNTIDLTLTLLPGIP